MTGGGEGKGNGGCMHNALLLLEGLSVCERILQRQHWHYWLSLISIKKCSFRASDGREEAANKGGRVKRGKGKRSWRFFRASVTKNTSKEQKGRQMTQTHKQ